MRGSTRRAVSSGILVPPSMVANVDVTRQRSGLRYGDREYMLAHATTSPSAEYHRLRLDASLRLAGD